MRASTAVQTVIFLAFAVVLGVAVSKSADGWADWVVFSVVVLFALGAAIAVNNRMFPAPTKKRRFTRDSESDW